METLGRRLGWSRVLSHQSSWVARKLFPRIRNWRVASRVGLRLALLACWGTDTGRMKRTLRLIAGQSAGRKKKREESVCSKHPAITAILLYYIPWARVQQCCTVPGRIIDCPALVRCAYDSRSRLRVGLLQALAWYRTPHSQRRTCTASASNAVRRCVRKKGWACGEVPWRADTVGQSAARWTESASRALSLAAWEVAVRHGEVAIGAWAGPMYVCSKYVPGMPRYVQR